MSKVLEKVICKHINKHITENNVLPPQQFGFRAAHSANHQIARLLTDITTKLNQRHHTAFALIDLEKVFDRVWTEGLLYELIHHHFPQAIISILRSYLTGRTFAVKVNRSCSSTVRIPAGVPQGGPRVDSLQHFYLRCSRSCK